MFSDINGIRKTDPKEFWGSIMIVAGIFGLAVAAAFLCSIFNN